MFVFGVTFRNPQHGSFFLTQASRVSMSESLEQFASSQFISLTQPARSYHDHTKASGADLILGVARFVAPRPVEIDLRDGGTRTITEIGCSLTLARSPRFLNCLDWPRPNR